jgi:flagellar protein FliO/FliZ
VLSFFGIEASQRVQFAIAFAIILILLVLFGLVFRKLTGARLMMPSSDRGRSRQPRLGIVDIYDLDRQRQLILLRRDNVEHLLLIGGLNDVVIETNIVRVAGARLPAQPSEAGPERLEPSLDGAPRPP